MSGSVLVMDLVVLGLGEWCEELDRSHRGLQIGLQVGFSFVVRLFALFG